MSVQQEKIKQLLAEREETRLGEGKERIERQHARGKYTAHECITMLPDEGSFEEIDMPVQHRCTNFGMEKKKFLGDGIVVGSGTIDGRLVYVFAQDFTVTDGTLDKIFTAKIYKVVGLTIAMGAPCIGLNDSGGAHIQEAVDALCGYGEIFERNILASGVIPRISNIFGPCAGDAVYSPALTNFSIMVCSSSYMFLTGPRVVKTVTGEDITREELGGADVHAFKSGMAYFAVDSDEAGLQLIRQLLFFLPQNNMEEPPLVARDDPADRYEELLSEIIPDSPGRAYDVYEVIGAIVNHNEFLEIHRNYACNIIVGFARFSGQSVGIVASQPKVMAGSLDHNSSHKAARFVCFCDSFDIPIVTLVDVPGFLPDTGQKHNAVIARRAKPLCVYGEVTVPKITVVLRKACGGAYIVMDSRHLCADVSYAWSSAEIAVMGPSGAVEVVFAKEAEAGDDPTKTALEKEQEYRDAFANPYNAASYSYIDDVIEPGNTRFRIIRVLQQLCTKRQTLPTKKRDDVPL